MALLNIRNLPDDVHMKLRIRAAKHGRSMEAEAREILAEAVHRSDSVLPPEELQTFVDRLYGDHKPQSVVDDLLEERRREAQSE